MNIVNPNAVAVNMGAALEATSYDRDSCGWRGETKIGLPGHADKELVLTTRKPSFQSGLLTTACVRRHIGNGLMEFGTESFYKHISRTAPKRVTEKTVREQHLQALRELDVIVQQAVAYYAARQRQVVKPAAARACCLTGESSCSGRGFPPSAHGVACDAGATATLAGARNPVC
ncbi:MAG: hypothetical protein IKX21_00460 [Deltaproteobacteria bacterium]|nr:hypothetical protein [Deltaproteobacteria bacterium]